MSVAARKAVQAQDELEDFHPRSEFARRLWEIRLRIEAQGGDFLDWEGLEREVTERRGERSNEH
jgi:hypothetical protein